MTKFLSEHVYSHEEKQSHLREFIDSLQAVLEDAALNLYDPKFTANHTHCLARARELINSNFTQSDLSDLSRSFDLALWTHKDWEPPLERASDGVWREPAWYPAFEKLYERVAKATQRLKETGEVKYAPDKLTQ